MSKLSRSEVDRDVAADITWTWVSGDSGLISVRLGVSAEPPAAVDHLDVEEKWKYHGPLPSQTFCQREQEQTWTESQVGCQEGTVLFH